MTGDIAATWSRTGSATPPVGLCHPDTVPAPGRASRAEGQFVFRPTTGIAACVLWGLLAVFWLASAAGFGWSTLLAQLPAVALISTVVYAVCGRPRVIVKPEEVLLRNVVRDTTIPYTAISEIDTRYTLTITTVDGRRHQAWAAPAGGRFGAARVTDEERKSLSLSGPVEEIPASAGLRSDAGAAAVAIRRRWQAITERGDAGPGPGVATVRWASGVLMVLGISFAAAVVAAVV